MQALSLILTTEHTTAVLELLAQQQIFTGNETGSRVEAQHGDLHIRWQVPTYGEFVEARAAIDGWAEHAKRAGLIQARPLVTVFDTEDEPFSEEEQPRTLTLVSRFAKVCEDILVDFDFCDFDEGIIVEVDDEDACDCGTSHDYWRLTVRIDGRRTSELIAWCEHAQRCRMLKSYELL